MLIRRQHAASTAERQAGQHRGPNRHPDYLRRGLDAVGFASLVLFGLLAAVGLAGDGSVAGDSASGYGSALAAPDPTVHVTYEGQSGSLDGSAVR